MVLSGYNGATFCAVTDEMNIPLYEHKLLKYVIMSL